MGAVCDKIKVKGELATHLHVDILATQRKWEGGFVLESYAVQISTI